jgi:c(7)-type cytochrome triheme protein
MKRAFALGALAVLACVTSGTARAVPPGLTIEFDGNGEGKVVFAGAQHTGPGMHCSNCHMEIFYVSRSSQITRADHRRHQTCFVCHDGNRAFAARSNCDRCHAEPEPQGPAPETAAAVVP